MYMGHSIYFVSAWLCWVVASLQPDYKRSVKNVVVETDSSSSSRLDGFVKVEDFLNVCMDASSHKHAPGPESKLFKLCAPWEDWSCCTEQTSQDLHVNSSWYKFSWDHCAPLSDRCRGHFQKDLCFYECDPNVGPWLVKEERKWRKERQFKVPMCDSECFDWFHDCKDDMTCVEKWSKDFDWSKGTQKCPKTASGQRAQCRKFSEIYSSPKHFCESVWDDAWEVVPDESGCMSLWFDDGGDNNFRIAQLKAEQIVKSLNKGQRLTLGVFSYAVLSVTCVFALFT